MIGICSIGSCNYCKKKRAESQRWPKQTQFVVTWRARGHIHFTHWPESAALFDGSKLSLQCVHIWRQSTSIHTDTHTDTHTCTQTHTRERERGIGGARELISTDCASITWLFFKVQCCFIVNPTIYVTYKEHFVTLRPTV